MSDIQYANKLFDSGSYTEAFNAYENIWRETGNLDVIIQVCWMLYSGLGVDRNSRQAIDALTELSINDYRLSFAIAGMLYRLKRYGECYQWFLKAKSEGSLRSYVYLGVLFEFGYGVSTDIDKAIYYYKEGEKRGSLACRNRLLQVEFNQGKKFAKIAYVVIKRIFFRFYISLLMIRKISDERLYDVYPENKILTTSFLINRRHP